MKMEGGKTSGSIKFLSHHHLKGLKGTLGSPLLRLACSGLPASGSSWPLMCSWGDVPECEEGKSSDSCLAWPFPLSGKLLI